MKISTLLLCVAMICGICVHSSADTSAYTVLNQRISKLVKSDNVRLLAVGKSVTGRDIPAFVISDYSVPSAAKNRIFIMSGQHGDELNPIKSVVSFCENMVSGVYPGILAKNLIVVVPFANPDGVASGSRYNFQGSDINRDWSTLSCPETRFVHNVIKLMRPHVLIDTHEWKVSPEFPGNGIELAWSASSIQRKSMGQITRLVNGIAGLAQIECRKDSNISLFHRRYSRLGYSAFLLETEPDLSYIQKEKAYKRSFIAVMSALGSDKALRSHISPCAVGWNIGKVEMVLGSLEGKKPENKVVWRILLIIGPCVVCYILFVIKPRKRKRIPLRHWRLRPELNEAREPHRKAFSNHRYMYRL